VPRRALFVLPVVLAGFIAWKAWQDLNSNVRKHPEEFSKHQDKPDNRGRERRLVQVHNPKAKRTYLIDLNAMPTCDGLEPDSVGQRLESFPGESQENFWAEAQSAGGSNT
jgi:hypothetical protein